MEKISVEHNTNDPVFTQYIFKFVHVGEKTK